MTSIRPAVLADMAAVADLWHAGWHDGHAGLVPDGLTAARTLAAFRERTPPRVADTTVAVSHGGSLAGFAMVVGDEVDMLGRAAAGPVSTSEAVAYLQASASRSTISVSRSGDVAMLSRTCPFVPGA